MVVDVGGNPGNFSSRIEMAAYIIDQEQPLSVVREADESEMLGGTLQLGAGPTAAGDNFWGVGRWQGSSLVISPSTQAIVERVERQ
jgi:hypothetical protein